MKAKPPRRDSKELFFSEQFLNSCKFCYGAIPSSQENEEKPFLSKYFNVIDPLCANNNLGRSISKGSSFRIKSAIALGVQRLVRLLDCPKDNIIPEFDLFFKNTWDRNGNGYWMDAYFYNLYVRHNDVKTSTSHESEVDRAQASHGIYQHLEESKQMPGTSNIEHASSMKNALTKGGQNPTYSSNDVHDMLRFTRFYPSPEFAHMYSEVPTQHWYPGLSERESGQIHSAPSSVDNSSSSRYEVLDNHNIRIPCENQQSFGKISYDWRYEDAVDPGDTSSGYYYDFGPGVNNEIGLPVDEAMLMHQEDHRFPYFNGCLQTPIDASSSSVSFPSSPPAHVLPSEYTHGNTFNVLHANVPSFDSFSDQVMPYSQDLVPFPSFEWSLNKQGIAEPVDYNELVAHSDHERQMANNSGSSPGNSSSQTGSTSYMPKDYAVTTEQNWLTEERERVDPPDARIIKGDVNYRASSSYPPLHSTSRANPSSSTFSIGSSSKTFQPDGVSGDRISKSTVGTDWSENTTIETDTPCVQTLQTVPNSSLPDTPLHVDPGSSKRAVDNQILLPVSCGSSGPSFQVPNMFPNYHLLTDTGTSLDMDAALGNHYTPESIVDVDSTPHSDTFPVNRTSHDEPSDNSVKESHDILDGDFTSYWVNMQYGRFCQNRQSDASLLYRPSFQMYLRGQFPWYRKPSGVMNITSQDCPPVPVMTAQLASALPGGTTQHAGFWLPRLSDGTGTYLPNPTSYQQRIYRRKDYPRENFRYDRRDNHNGREGISNWNSRFSTRGQFHNTFERRPGTIESSHHGERPRSAFNRLTKFDRDSIHSSPRNPSA
ncbi:uncharacterized protein LOC113853107 [Abrus precatorius]|uniref:Uncharacterized protein LOC113853107 n=1 Tax=Abrus precatorius TaxID=3816 RepID=A0A8B8K6H7_ABRPR|nr:uncharacterized protein LOC113853107 [Abrus precatorius]